MKILGILFLVTVVGGKPFDVGSDEPVCGYDVSIFHLYIFARIFSIFK